MASTSFSVAAGMAPPGTFHPRAPTRSLLLSTDVCRAGAAGRPLVLSAPRFAAAAPSPAPPPGLATASSAAGSACSAAPAYHPGKLLASAVACASPPRAPAPTSSACSTVDPSEGDDARSAGGEVDEPTAPGGPPGLSRQPFSLEAALAERGSSEVVSSRAPTEGSKGHQLGTCRPCAFVYKGGCNSGAECKFCHLCPPEEKKMRKKHWREQKRAAAAGPSATGPGA